MGSHYSGTSVLRPVFSIQWAPYFTLSQHNSRTPVLGPVYISQFELYFMLCLQDDLKDMTAQMKNNKKVLLHERKRHTARRVESTHSVVLLFFFLINFCLDQGPFCGATDCSCFGLRVSFLMGFKSRVDILPALFLACMLWSWRSRLVGHLPFPPIGVYTV